MPPNPPLLTSIPFAMWLCSLSQQEVKPASISPEVESGLPCDFLWPVEFNGSDSVPRLGLKKPCGIPCSLRNLLAPCERARASLQKDGRHVKKSPVVPTKTSLHLPMGSYPQKMRTHPRSTEVTPQPIANHKYISDPSQDQKNHPDNPSTHKKS